MGERNRHFVFFSEPSDVQGAQGLGEKPPSFPSAVLGFNPQSRHILEYLITIGYGALGYFLGGHVPPETPNWHPVLKKISPKIDTPF